MLQRIQTVFLLLAAAAMLVATVTPLATFLYNADKAVFEAMGVYLAGEVTDSTWGLFVIGAATSALALITVFLYNSRMLQVRLTVFNILLMVGFYLYFGFIVYQLVSADGLHFQKVGVGAIMPAIGIIFSILAVRKILQDEALVRSLSRLRR